MMIKALFLTLNRGLPLISCTNIILPFAMLIPEQAQGTALTLALLHFVHPLTDALFLPFAQINHASTSTVDQCLEQRKGVCVCVIGAFRMPLYA